MTPIKCGHGLLHQIFEEQARKTPSALAIKSNGNTYTYQETARLAQAVVSLLHAHGIKSHDRIGIYFCRSALPVIAMLGILKAGCTYIPLSRGFPPNRIQYIIHDANIKVILTEPQLVKDLNSITSTPHLSLIESKIKLNKVSFSKTIPEIKPTDLCYIIYTSGTTGKPKGVMTQHANVVHFIHSFKEVCQLTSNDRIYNGFAYSFDGSVEEMWMAFSNGAALIVASDDVAGMASEAAKMINEEQITFFSTVPTFLSMIEEKLSSVRLLILSGEVCPQKLVNKWAGNNCRLLNVYGPTETTVNATSWECQPGKEVSIGRPLPNYPIFILDEQLRPVKKKEKGELYIGGEGLAQGYLNQKELTNRQFIYAPVYNQRLFRTGDLVSMNDKEELLFHGRIDAQVKIRGYRIELTEIETVLMSIKNIAQAVVCVYKHNETDELAAYIKLNHNSIPPSYESIHAHLKQHLPSYMIPSTLDIIHTIPQLHSGKINKKALPIPVTPLINSSQKYIPPHTTMQKLLVNVWQKLFKTEQISITDDFFMDLSGHSLTAAHAVSLLRYKHHIELAIRDIYLNPTIEQLAKVAAIKQTTASKETINTEPIKQCKHTFIKILQAISLYFIYGLALLPMALLMIFILTNATGHLPLNQLIPFTLLLALCIHPLMLITGIIIKWLIIGKIKPGIYPLYGSYYYRWWLTDKITQLTGVQLLAGSPLMPLFYRLMGAQIGKNCIIDTHLSSAWDMISIGNNSSIGHETQIMGCTISNNSLLIGPVSIKNNCFIGIHCYIGINTVMESHTVLGDLSAIQDEKQTCKHISLQGSPPIVRKIELPQGKAYKQHPFRWAFYHVLTLLLLFTIVYTMSIPTLLVLMTGLQSHSLTIKIISILISGPLTLFSFCCITTITKTLIFNKIKPGTYKTESFFYLRKWLIDNLIRLSVIFIKPLYTTIYFPVWLRMLGAKTGHRAEISTVSQISPELMDIGDESFFADGSIIGGRHFYQGYMEISRTSIGKRSFIGNSAILPVGTNIGDGCLIGVLSSPPITKGTIPNNTDWLGSPSFKLPHRQKIKSFNHNVLYNPSHALIIKRYFIDALRIFIPTTIELSGALALFYFLNNLIPLVNSATLIAFIPPIGIAISIVSALFVVALKWIIMGNIKPIIKPLWCTFVWYNEVINGAWESITARALAPMLGTPFFTPFLRLMGCKMGKNIYMGTTLFSEFDLVNIGDNVVLNAGVVIQNHLFEDRIMKASSLKIEQDCNIGNMSIILYDSILNHQSNVLPLSLVMKGEQLPPSTSWQGIPCQAIHNLTSLPAPPSSPQLATIQSN